MNNTSIKLIPIKKVAGRILLYFYYLYRTNPELLSNWKIDYNSFSKSFHTENRIPNEIDNELNEISSNDKDIINALDYLIDSGFLSAGDKGISLQGNASYFLINLTNYGIDIIESIEQGAEQKKNFEINFNITVEKLEVESLLKAELGSIFKASVLG